MKKNLLRVSLTIAALLILLTTTDPRKLPSLILIIPFAAFFLLAFYSAKWTAMRRATIRNRATRIAVLCASLPTLLLVLLSLGQLTMKDLATVGILFILSYFYIARNAFENEN